MELTLASPHNTVKAGREHREDGRIQTTTAQHCPPPPHNQEPVNALVSCVFARVFIRVCECAVPSVSIFLVPVSESASELDPQQSQRPATRRPCGEVYAMMSAHAIYNYPQNSFNLCENNSVGLAFFFSVRNNIVQQTGRSLVKTRK